MSPRFALGAGGLALVIALAVLVGLGLSDGFDRPIIEAVREPGLRDLLSPLRVITELGSTWAITAMAAVAFVFGAAIGPWRHGLIGALTIGAASRASSSLKLATT